MIVGCVPVIEVRPGRFLAINCAKGRGYIMPGGKHEEGETFSQTAQREGSEETGVTLIYPKLVFGGADGFNCYCYAFRCAIHEDGKQPEDVIGCDFGSGRVVLASWDDLKGSKFRAYYELLEQACER